MSDVQKDPDWWLGVDGKWYPPVAPTEGRGQPDPSSTSEATSLKSAGTGGTEGTSEGALLSAPWWRQNIAGLIAVAGTAVLVLAIVIGAIIAADDPDRPASSGRITSSSTSSSTSAPVFDGFKECEGSERLQEVTASGTNVLGITWTTFFPLVGETASYYVQAYPYQIGLRRLPQGEVARFVFDFETSKQTNLTSTYILDGTTAQLIVPFSAVPKLNPHAHWEATITLNGLDLESCTMVTP